ncbi:Wings apart-like protein C-terminal domain-containing protein [Madurella fahalii]|uniref:Wings apart-like protein C-terminal domain-containing protein n=1 Tax=Madurella fahalii TaxID=1157608 RepID=A0ABQ0G9B1_9PEZI
MASTSDFDFGFAPKKKVTTYGKAGRRRPQATPVGVLRHAESAPVIPTASTFTSPSSSPEPYQPLARATDSSKGRPRQQGHTKNPGVRQKPPEEAESQPLPEIAGIEPQHDDGARAKKRRLVRGYSDKGRFDGPYSTPDSSPSGGRSSGSEADEEIPRSAPNATRAVASRNTPEKDIGMEDAGSAPMPFSAKTSRAFKNLSVSSKQPERNKQQIPIRLSAQVSSSKAVPKPTPRSQTTAADTHTPGPTARTTRKRRLIDALAAQAEDETSSGGEEASSQASAIPHAGPTSAFRDSSPPALSSLNQPKTLARPVIAAKKTGPKFTYSQQRTMLADDDDLLGGAGFDDLGNGSAGGALFNFGRLTKSSTINTFSYLDEDDETVNTGAVRSLHELRQAGANSRFADEMDDILDRIGSPSAKPSSLRRGALLEVAQKMKHKDFRQQFRNHSDGGNLFKSLGEETDLVSGYAVLAIVTTLLAATTSAHLIQQLRSQGLPKLISRLLGESTDIAQLAKDRKHNVSRNAQITLTTIRGSLLDLPIWEPFSPTLLSPRTLALKCLDLFMRQSTHTSADDEVFSQVVSDCLFSILSDGVSDPGCWDFPHRQESCDFYLALYVLEGHSINAMQSRLSSRWTKQYAPTVADVLETALDRPADKFDDLESLTLRISLNITNHNGEASRLFVEKGLLGRLAKSACVAFGVVLNSMKVDSFLSKVLESLIMMLGAMINFCVYYPPASATLEERDDGVGSPLNQLIRVFADNHSKTGDADSMEETQLNVALGYLSILLGYLCLRESIRDRFVSVHPKKRVQPLLDSINEFIAFHHKVAEAQGRDESKQDSATAALARLQSLVDQLAAQG